MNKEAELQKENAELREAWLKLADCVVELEAGLAAMRSQASVSVEEFCRYCGGNDETPQDHCMDCTRPSDDSAKVPAPSQVAAEVVQVQRELLERAISLNQFVYLDALNELRALLATSQGEA